MKRSVQEIEIGLHCSDLAQDLRVHRSQNSLRGKDDQEIVLRGDGENCKSAGKDVSKKT